MRKILTSWVLIIGAFLLLLYPTICLHELGHAIAAYQFGCKADWWSTSVTPFLLQSSGGAIDYACIADKGNVAYGWLGWAGIIVNLGVAFGAYLLGRAFKSGGRSGFIKAGFYIFAVLNFIEAFSYLSINAIWPRSDIILIFRALEVSNMAFGVVAALIGLVLVPILFRSSVSQLNSSLTISHAKWPVAVMSLSIFAVMTLGRMGFGG